MTHRPTRSALFVPGLVIVLLAPALARASCEPVVAAYAKAEATGRYALFDVARINAPAKGAPFQITVGNDGYIDPAGNSGTYQKTSARIVAGEGRSVQEREQQGKVRCEPPGDRKIGDEPAIGDQIRNNDKGSAPDPTATHM